MFRGKESIFVTIICAAGMGMFVALWLLDFAVVRISACEAIETRGLCLRGWISALSGWAAAIGALIAAGLTIAKLREQITDQKRQTDFIIGDSLPIVEWSQEPTHFRITIKNFNRHATQLIAVENESAFNISFSFKRPRPVDSVQTIPHTEVVEKFNVFKIKNIARIIANGYEGSGTIAPKIEILAYPTQVSSMDQARAEFKIKLFLQIQDLTQRQHILSLSGESRST